jgi:peroxiredoxin
MSPLSTLPNDLPVPLDDGAADHLAGARLPSTALETTDDTQLNLSQHESEWLVLYIYPMTGRPDQDLPSGWEQIPGARGCTPQSCSFRDHYAALHDLGAQVVGLSVQTTEYQREMVERLHLPYPVASDSDRKFGTALKLPTMSVKMADGRVTHLYRRITLIVQGGQIQHVMYPVFPPDQNAGDVENWLRNV